MSVLPPTVKSPFWHVYVLWLGVYWWKRDIRALHDVTSDMSQNVTSERYTTWRQICPKTWRLSVTRRDVRYVPRKTRFRCMAPSRECASCLAHIAIRELASGSMLLDTSLVPQYHCTRPVMCHSQYDNWTSIWLRCFWILLEFRNTTVRVRSRVIRNMIIELQSDFDASGYFSSSAIPLYASGHVSFAIW